jgi:membrane protease YdiL (CAAX protease family)
MAWAYLRSGSVAVPLVMHAGGNLVVMLLRPSF